MQTQPTYLARLVFHTPQSKTTRFVESVIFSLYNYASTRREAYLLLQLFKTALQEEIRWAPRLRRKGKGAGRDGCMGSSRRVEGVGDLLSQPPMEHPATEDSAEG